jgi:hypothetical protein
MAVLKRQFFHHEHGVGDQDWYYLARDTDSGHVFVLREWSHRTADTFVPGSGIIEIPVFLNGHGPAEDELLRLIGILVQDDSEALNA